MATLKHSFETTFANYITYFLWHYKPWWALTSSEPCPEIPASNYSHPAFLNLPVYLVSISYMVFPFF